MALSDAKRLYDITTRHQIYVEGVKLQHAREFNFVLSDLKKELDRLLSRIKYKTLDGMTKAELNRFIVTLRASQSRIYSKYAEQLLEDLKAFMSVDLQVSRIMLATARFEIDAPEDEEIPELSDDDAIEMMQDDSSSSGFIPLFGIAAAVGSDKLWSNVTNAPIPANGIYLVPFVKGFTTSAQASVENIIRKAYANGWTVQETIAEITGEESRQGTSTQLQRISVQGAAVIDTAMQHVTNIVAAAVGSALFAMYQWFSVMDGGTTDVCRSRNNRRYRYGDGPLPPAHIKCRSHIAPSVGADFEAESFYTWIARQPASVQADTLGDAGAEALQSGRLRARDLQRFEASEPLTLREFRRRISEILTR